MTARARQLAESCFAVARSTTHAGERRNAIGRGEAICAKHGLDLDGFDIPGRRRAPRPETSFRFTAKSFRRAPAGDFLRQCLADLERAQQAAADRAGAGEDETPYDASRRNFDRETAAAAERDQRRQAC